MAGCCECENEPLSFIECGEFLVCLRTCLFLCSMELVSQLVIQRPPDVLINSSIRRFISVSSV